MASSTPAPDYIRVCPRCVKLLSTVWTMCGQSSDYNITLYTLWTVQHIRVHIMYRLHEISTRQACRDMSHIAGRGG